MYAVGCIATCIHAAWCMTSDGCMLFVLWLVMHACGVTQGYEGGMRVELGGVTV